ncbi:hypothetical protein OAN33_06985 [Flavobacteriales bacterium]|nr:hypothetical protein [Flavobacteriales bacterium]
MKMKFLGAIALAGLAMTSCSKAKLASSFADEISTEESQINLPESGYEINVVEPTQSTADGYYTEGVIEYTKNGAVLASVDFGNGASNSQALANVNGTTSEIELKKDKEYYKGKKSKYKKVIVEPIIKTDECGFIVSGIIKYYKVKSGDWVATVDFGDGTCDDIAVKTTDEGKYTFTISEYFK